MIKRVLIGASLAAALIPSPSFAWGREGHETVGYLAATLLRGTAAEQHIRTILGSGESLATAAEWLDCAKGYTYCHADPTQEMNEFAARNPKHKSYHYTDLPFQFHTYAKNRIGSDGHDVVHALEDAILTLQGKSPADPAHKFTEREALFVLAHMTGDIHQPMHVGAAYIASDEEFIVPKSEAEAKASFTQGANLLCVGPKNLHSFWDDDLVTKAMRQAKAVSSEDFAEELLPKASKFKGDTGDVLSWPAKWATGSLQLSSLELSSLTVERKRRAGPDRSPCRASDPASKGYVWDVTLPDQYAADGASAVNDQLAKAGARLAKLLTAIWP